MLARVWCATKNQTLQRLGNNSTQGGRRVKGKWVEKKTNQFSKANVFILRMKRSEVCVWQVWRIIVACIARFLELMSQKQNTKAFERQFLDIEPDERTLL